MAANPVHHLHVLKLSVKHIALALAAALALAGCSSTRHVPAGSYMLDNAKT